MSLKSALTASSSWCNRAEARRRSCRVPALPRVIIFSATDRAALALARVVMTRRCLIRLQTRLASMRLRWVPVRPSLAVRLRWRIRVPLFDFVLLLGRFQEGGINVHAQREAQAGQLLFDLVER